MIKIYGYELRRLFLSKYMAALLILTPIYCMLVLSGETVLGTANTAPFSAWSLGSYLSRVAPLICLGELLFVTFYTSGAERLASAITSATPADKLRYAFARCGAVLTCVAAATACALAPAFIFMKILFGWTDYPDLFIPALIALLPPALFYLGAGLLAGRIRPVLVYLLMVSVFALSGLPGGWGAAAGRFFSEFPLAAGALDPAFAIPAGVLGARACYAGAGAAMLILAALS